MVKNKSGFEIGDRVRIHRKDNIPNCCEGKTGIVVGIYEGKDQRFHGCAKVILDDKEGCFDFDGELDGEYGIVCDQDNAVLISPSSIEGQSGLIVGHGMGDYAVLFDRKMSNSYVTPFGGEDSFVTGFDPRKHNAKLFWFIGGIYEEYMVPEIKTAFDLEEMI